MKKSRLFGLLAAAAAMVICTAVLSTGTLAYFRRSTVSEGNVIRTSAFDNVITVTDKNGSAVAPTVENVYTLPVGEYTASIGVSGETDGKAKIIAVSADAPDSELVFSTDAIASGEAEVIKMYIHGSGSASVAFSVNWMAEGEIPVPTIPADGIHIGNPLFGLDTVLTKDGAAISPDEFGTYRLAPGVYTAEMTLHDEWAHGYCVVTTEAGNYLVPCDEEKTILNITVNADGEPLIFRPCADIAGRTDLVSFPVNEGLNIAAPIFDMTVSCPTATPVSSDGIVSSYALTKGVYEFNAALGNVRAPGYCVIRVGEVNYVSYLTAKSTPIRVNVVDDTAAVDFIKLSEISGVAAPEAVPDGGITVDTPKFNLSLGVFNAADSAAVQADADRSYTLAKGEYNLTLTLDDTRRPGYGVISVDGTNYLVYATETLTVNKITIHSESAKLSFNAVESAAGVESPVAIPDGGIVVGSPDFKVAATVLDADSASVAPVAENRYQLAKGKYTLTVAPLSSGSGYAIITAADAVYRINSLTEAVSVPITIYSDSAEITVTSAPGSSEAGVELTSEGFVIGTPDFVPAVNILDGNGAAVTEVSANLYTLAKGSYTLSVAPVTAGSSGYLLITVGTEQFRLSGITAATAISITVNSETAVVSVSYGNGTVDIGVDASQGIVIGTAVQGGTTGGNAGENTGNSGENTGNTGENTGNSGDNTGNAGENTGNSGENTGNTGENTGNTGNTGNSGENTGNTGENTGNSGENTGNTGENTGNSGENTGNSGENTGNSGENTGNTGENTGNIGENTGNSGENTGNTGENTGNTTGNATDTNTLIGGDFGGKS